MADEPRRCSRTLAKRSIPCDPGGSTLKARVRIPLMEPHPPGVLNWARQTGARVAEDDYDSEYRFAGRPIPALQGLDRTDCVIFLGSFSKVLFSSLDSAGAGERLFRP